MGYVLDVNIREGKLGITLVNIQEGAEVEWQGVISSEGHTAQASMTGFGNVKFRVNGGQWLVIEVDRHRAMYRASQEGFSFGV